MFLILAFGVARLEISEDSRGPRTLLSGVVLVGVHLFDNVYAAGTFGDA